MNRESSSHIDQTEEDQPQSTAFTIVSMPSCFQDGEIWTNLPPNTNLTLQAVPSLEPYNLSQGVVVEALIPLPGNADKSIISEDSEQANVDEALRNESAIVNKEKAKKQQIFSTLTGMLSSSFMDSLPEDHHPFFKTLESKFQIAVKVTTEGTSVSGSFDEMIRLENSLKLFLLRGNIPENKIAEKDKNGSWSSLKPEMADKEISCNLLLPRISLHGREVKQHSRYVNYFHFPDSNDEDFNKVKRRKRVGRPRRMHLQIRHSTVDNGRRPSCDQSTGDRSLQQAQPSNGGSIADDGKTTSFKATDDIDREGVKNADEINEHEAKDSCRLPMKMTATGRRIPKKDYEALAPFKFFCKKCSFKSKRESHFVKHMKLHEKQMNLFQCKKCSFTSIRLSHLRRHEVLHSVQILRCQECHYSTDNAKLLARHIKNKHELQRKHHTIIHSCPKCKYKTIRAHLFEHHLQTHEELAGEMSNHLGKALKTYQCDLCPYKTHRKEHYVRHRNNVHCNRRPYLCDLCGKAFKRPDALAQHKFTHMDKSARVYPFTCSVCEKGFRSQAHLNEHMTMHSNVRSHLCHYCGASFKTRSVQQKHIQTIHVNPRSYSCDQCDKRFNTKYAMRRHKRTHDTPGMRELQQLTPGTVQQVTVQTLQSVDQQQQELVQDVMTSSIDETYDQGADVIRQPLIQSNEATTALLYLTSNLPSY